MHSETHFVCVKYCLLWIFVFCASHRAVSADLCETLAGNPSQIVSETQAQLHESVQLYCFNGKAADAVRINHVDSDAELRRKINITAPIKIATHGYNHDNKTWFVRVAKKWAARGNNGCYLYYAKLGTTPPYSYFQIAKIILPIMAEHVVDILERLAAVGVPISDTELAGHSLGCQLMGQIARAMTTRDARVKIKRIFGLDCAQPCFTFPEIVSNRTKADLAEIVQCLHTSFYFGQIVPCGCQDIYIDSIVVDKCEIPTNASSETMTDMANCNHAFAFRVFEATMEEDDQCQAVNFFSILMPFLGRDHMRVGIYCDDVCRNAAMFYLSTNKNPPYCSAE